MKKLICFLLAAILLLSGCGKTPLPDPTPEVIPTEAPVEETQPPFAFTAENFPRMDGSTATKPMAEAVYAELLGVSREEAAETIHFSKTTQSYYNLIDGRADILIVYEGNEAVEDYRERMGFSWEKTAFANDAFVFLVNEENPVDSITIDQARRIYTGEITNWAQLGGADMEIIPFQRNAGAGSQTLMEKLVMQGQPMMEAPSAYMIAGMGELIQAVKGYDNSPGAIGYSVYYYAEEMRMAQGLKLLAIEGVAPTSETIHSEAYPLINPLYVVISANEAEDSPARTLYDWLLSAPGQQLAGQEGYVPILDFETVPRAATPLAGGRWYDDYMEDLIPRDNYGMLIPYAGQRVENEMFLAIDCVYGLMTRDGLVVTDPVYMGVWAHFGKLLSLCKVVDGQRRYAIAAMDGSWRTEYDYLAVRHNNRGLTLFSRDGLALMTPEGGIPTVLPREQLGLTEEQFEGMIQDTLFWGGWAGEWHGHYIALGQDRHGLFYDLETGETVALSDEEWLRMDEVLWDVPEPVIENAWHLFDRLLGDDAPYLLELVVPSTETEPYHYEYYYADGTPIPALTRVEPEWYETVRLVGGLIEVLEADTASYYDLETLDCVFRTHLNYEPD